MLIPNIDKGFTRDNAITHVVQCLSELEELERTYVQSLIGRMSGEQILEFMAVYRQRRKDPQMMLLASIIGLVAFPGFQRFWLGQIGMGFLYLFTGGLLLIGTLSDLARYKTLAWLHNQRIAREVAKNMRLWVANNPVKCSRQNLD